MRFTATRRSSLYSQSTAFVDVVSSVVLLIHRKVSALAGEERNHPRLPADGADENRFFFFKAQRNGRRRGCDATLTVPTSPSNQQGVHSFAKLRIVTGAGPTPVVTADPNTSFTETCSSQSAKPKSNDPPDVTIAANGQQHNCSSFPLL